jgi:hypothetical protein
MKKAVLPGVRHRKLSSEVLGEDGDSNSAASSRSGRQSHVFAPFRGSDYRGVAVKFCVTLGLDSVKVTSADGGEKL